MSYRPDNVERLALDHSASDLSSAGSIAAAVADTAAQTDRTDCLNIGVCDVIIDLSSLGTGPIAKLTVVGRTSAKADPDVTAAGDWTTINTESIDTVTGISTITPYIAVTAISATGSYIVSFPIRGRYFSALVWVDAGGGSRGQIFTFRRNQE